MKDIINNLTKFNTWKIQLIIAVNFISSKDTYEKVLTHSKSDYIEIMIYDKADELIKKLFQSLLYRYQTFRNEMYWLYYKCHNINLNRCRLYVDLLLEWRTKKQQKILSMMMINSFNTLQQFYEIMKKLEIFAKNKN